LTRDDATIASKICGATPALLSLANFMLAPFDLSGQFASGCAALAIRFGFEPKR
jgi:hypothetical protein